MTRDALQRLGRSTWAPAILGAVGLWSALPPLGFWPLAWLAPAAWAVLVRRGRLEGRRPYLTLWAVGFGFWLASLYWLTLPHWAAGFGWLALSFYFAFYLPAFIAISRVALHRWRVPLVMAVPTVWTGLELVRAHLLTGMTMASLGHTQYRWIAVIQIGDLGGVFAVSFLVMFVAACMARCLPCDGRRGSLWPLLPAAGALAAALVYGACRTSGEYTDDGARVALIQGSIDAKMKADENLRKKVFFHYVGVSENALEQFGTLDLMIWPETMFRDTLVDYVPGTSMPAIYRDKMSPEEFVARLEGATSESRNLVAQTARLLDTPLILGIDRHHYADGEVRYYNSAIHVARDGRILGCYDKMHPVMFGEYVPLGGVFPWLQRLTPLQVNLDAGQRPAMFEAGRLRLAPNICYETVLSHVIRRQINQLQAEGREPNVLVNLTNDGWFWGSSELDMHLICGVFRAVECRKPLLIAANTGFSAWIDGDGRIRAQGPRRAAAPLLAEVRLDQRQSWYLRHGDVFAGVCLAFCIAVAAGGPVARIIRVLPPLWGHRREVGSVGILVDTRK